MNTLEQRLQSIARRMVPKQQPHSVASSAPSGNMIATPGTGSNMIPTPGNGNNLMTSMTQAMGGIRIAENGHVP